MGSESECFKQRRHDATANLLISAAETTIARKGYDNVTMREIAAEAGCTPGTLYIYFRSKRDLVFAIMESHSNVALQGFLAAVNPALPPMERLRSIMQTGVEYFVRNRNLFRVLYSWAPIRPPTVISSLPANIRTEWEKFWRMELDIIMAAQAAGEIRRDFTPESIHRFMQRLVMGFFESISTQETPPPKEEQMRMLWGFFTGGIGAGRNDAANP